MQSSSALFGTFSPLTPAYWADARAQLKNVRMLTLAGIITAASIVLESFPIYLLGTSLKIYFSFLVISLGCYVYGPAVGILVGFANDTLGFLISSFGEPYFPGYLITAMLSGLIYGTLLYRQRITVLRLVVVRLIINYGSKYTSLVEGESVNNTVRPYYLEIPLHFGYRYEIGEGNMKIFGSFGPYFAIGLFGKAESDDGMESFESDVFGSDGMKRFDFGLGLRGGVELFDHYQVFLGYDWGLVDASNVTGIKIHNRNFYIGAAYLF